VIDQLTNALNALIKLHADVNLLLDRYVELVKQRDTLNLPTPAVRLTHVDTRSGLSLDLIRALELAKSDLENTKAPPVNAPSAALTLDPEITADISPRQAALQLKARRG
jgi:hypothetical protein